MPKNAKQLKIIFLILSSFVMTGGVLAGSSVSTYDKRKLLEPDSHYKLNRLVDIYPITPGLVKKLYCSPMNSTINQELE